MRICACFLASLADRCKFGQVWSSLKRLFQQLSGARKRVVSKKVVLADVSEPQTPERGYEKKERRYQKPERGYKNRNDGTKNRNKGTLVKNTPFLNCPFSPLEAGLFSKIVIVADESRTSACNICLTFVVRSCLSFVVGNCITNIP